MLATLALRRVSARSLAAGSHARALKILAADPVDPVCAQIFADAGHKLVEKKMTQAALEAEISGYDGLVVRSGVKVNAAVIAAGAGRLRLVGRAGAGVDNVDLPAATRRGIVVMNTPGGNTSAAAELTLSLITSVARSIPAACASLKAGKWERKAYSDGTELRGKRVGVVGLGMIGREVARRCAVLGMEPVGFDPQVTAEQAAAMGIKKVELEDIWRTSDFITVHTPLNDATRNLVCAATIAKCKKGVFIINAARGGIVNEADLLAALESGHVRGAATDVFDAEPPSAPTTKALIAHPRLVATPHLGASTEEAQKKVAAEIAQQMCDAFEGRNFVGVVNAPFLALSTQPVFTPFVKLAEALGKLQGQVALAGGALPKGTAVRVDVEGAALQERGFCDLARIAVLKGFLPTVASLELEEGSVNLVNAAHLAAEAGITVSVTSSLGQPSGPYANAIRVTVTSPTSGERLATGAVIEGEPRVVQVDHWSSFPSFAPSGHLLMYTNVDTPGQISRITNILSEFNINISSIGVARQFAGGGSPALSVVLCDSRLPADALRQLRALEGISNVRSASFAA